MGTRATILIKENNTPIVNIYFQFDGYLSGVGLELAKILYNVTLVNGYTLDQQAPEFANGGGCLAAQIVSAFKVGIGGVYLVSADYEEEYHYIIDINDGNIVVSIDDVSFTSMSEFLEYCKRG